MALESMKNSPLRMMEVGFMLEKITQVRESISCKVSGIIESHGNVLRGAYSTIVIFLPRWLVVWELGLEIGIPTCILLEAITLSPSIERVENEYLGIALKYSGIAFLLESRADFHSNTVNAMLQRLVEVLSDYYSDGETMGSPYSILLK